MHPVIFSGFFVSFVSSQVFALPIYNKVCAHNQAVNIYYANTQNLLFYAFSLIFLSFCLFFQYFSIPLQPNKGNKNFKPNKRLRL